MSNPLDRFLNPNQNEFGTGGWWNYGDASIVDQYDAFILDQSSLLPQPGVYSSSVSMNSLSYGVYGQAYEACDFIGPEQLANMPLQTPNFVHDMSQEMAGPAYDSQTPGWERDMEVEPRGLDADFAQQSLYLSPPTVASSQNSSQPQSVSPEASPSESSRENIDEEVICYGMLYNIDVKLVGNMGEIKSKVRRGELTYQNFKLKEEGIDHIILCFREDGGQFGILRSDVVKTLEPLIKSLGSGIDFIVSTASLSGSFEHANRSVDVIVKGDIYLYGQRQKALEIGDMLSKRKKWLQKPGRAMRNVEYENPQFLEIKLTEIKTQYVQPVNSGQPASNKSLSKSDREEVLQRMLNEVYKTLDSTQQLEMVEGGVGVGQDLLMHQKKALYFMLKREAGQIEGEHSLWEAIGKEEGFEIYRHKITNAKARDGFRPFESRGGILADEMGLGKSLSILALVVKTLEDGKQWASQQNASFENNDVPKHSGATLVVVPSTLLIDNWEEEIEKDVKVDHTVLKYHGPGRPTNVDAIVKHDIVITTYSTLTAEFQQKKGPSLLHQIKWWFETPFEQGEMKTVRDRLVVLLGALCLRRTREIVQLPEPQQITRSLKFTTEERKRYDETKGILLRRLKYSVGSPDEELSKFGLFQVNLQMRLLCNHGTFQQQFSWRRNFRDEQDVGISKLDQNGHVPYGKVIEDDEATYFNDEGYSTKIQAVIEDVRRDLATTKRTLDLLASHLKDAGIRYLRVDGSLTNRVRQDSLREFAQDADVRVLIMTTGTGGIGLNLTCANRIFLVEPQWNPGVESQAIARAIRLGQESEVLVTRYLVEDTEEEAILAQQIGKKRLAAMGFRRKEGANAS
ncbi:DNA repair and recombination protein rad5c [Grosmannia clavigera kw1407]|uniref:DNA repair and recombination protein rad5c n=1 Tax=Grosmannia clavigera (strain kw1407 / UAMH 11150) TaxID=655863 RepID=F0XMU1_GROCL|nr:DNA repair and recombination protein rad5c [Grosmannia clavigera kw1407]EFX01322.1 DNA repair and recombination protein rad5c [Grosmannia clavigera kw1407]